jgi:dethiobiotin synthetase
VKAGAERRSSRARKSARPHVQTDRNPAGAKPPKSGRKAPVIFITGTDTGVGKTLLTGLLLAHLRQSGCHALAMKPFCSGNRFDVRFLMRLQDNELSEDEVNPFYFPEPIAPWMALRKSGRNVPLSKVLAHIREVQARCDRLLIEGAGGLLVPLGKNYGVADLIKALDCAIIVVARNRLGTINHTLLTVNTIRAMGLKRVKVVLMDSRSADRSSRENKAILQEMLNPVEVMSLPFLGRDARREVTVRKNLKKIQKTVAHLGMFDTFTSFFRTAVSEKKNVDSRCDDGNVTA